MEKIALITDSTSDLSMEIINKYDVKVLPLKIIYKDKEYTDRVDITPEEVYAKLPIEMPSTSLPSMQDMDNLFTQLENEGYTHAIVSPISSGLSGTCNTFKLVANQHDKINIHVFDSKSLTLGVGELIIACGELINQGKSFDEIIKELPNLRDRIKVFFIVDTLQYLIKGGRIGKVSGTIGEILNIKPIISIDNEGVYYTYSKVRGKKQATNKLMDIVKNYLAESKCKVWVMHGGAAEEGRKFYDSLSSLENITSLNFGNISPVAGVHSGPGLVGIVIIKEV